MAYASWSVVFGEQPSAAKWNILGSNDAHFASYIERSGFPIQGKSVGYTTSTSGTTIIPFDDTIPQNTEGTEFMSLAITPTATNSILVIEAFMWCSYSITQHLIGALFQDSNANALAVNSEYQATAGGANMVALRHTMTAGTTSSTTFKVRGGGNSAGTFYFNGFSTGRWFGATTKSSIVITEYKG